MSNQKQVVFQAGDSQITAGFRHGGTLAGWLHITRHAPLFPVMRLLLYSSFSPVLLAILSIPNFIIDIAGRTSAGKSTLLKVAASVWGAVDQLIISWDATRVYAERTMATLCDLPIFLDDTKRVRNPKVIADFLYLIANGIGRARGNTTGVARTVHFRTICFSTGEAPATSHGQDGGARARVLSIRDLPFGATNDATAEVVAEINSGTASDYGHAGPLFVQHVIRNRHRWAEWKAQHQQLAAELGKGRPSEVIRLAQYGAAVAIAGQIAHEAIQFPFEYQDPFTGGLWDRIAAQAVDAAGAERAAADVLSWAFANEHRFHGRATDSYGNERMPTSWAGVWDAGEDWTEIAFFPTVLKEVLKEQEYHPEEILAQWEEKQWLRSSPSRKYQCRKTDGKSIMWVIAIQRAAFGTPAVSTEVVTLDTVSNEMDTSEDLPF